jgi:hypothetical protein
MRVLLPAKDTHVPNIFLLGPPTQANIHHFLHLKVLESIRGDGGRAEEHCPAWPIAER